MQDGLGGLFYHLKEYLETNCKWLNEVRLYNSQDVHGEDHVVVPPIIFIDYDNIHPDTQNADGVLHNLNITFKIYIQDYTLNYDTVFQYRKEVFDLLYNYQTSFFGLYYENQQKDKKATHLNMWDINFSCNCWETIGCYSEHEVNGTSGLSFNTTVLLDVNGQLEGTNFVAPKD